MSLTKRQKVVKRIFDIVVSFFGLLLTGWIILISAILAALDTRLSGFFTQTRIGQHGKAFKVIKLRSMKNIKGYMTTVSTDHDPRITRFGRFLRKTKIDELPQLINVFLGSMSFVGPRPDVPGFADKLEGEDRVILELKPGITGPASIYFKNEETLLADQENPEEYNRKVIWPKKVSLNKAYVKNYSLLGDINYIKKTIL